MSTGEVWFGAVSAWLLRGGLEVGFGGLECDFMSDASWCVFEIVCQCLAFLQQMPRPTRGRLVIRASLPV